MPGRSSFGGCDTISGGASDFWTPTPVCGISANTAITTEAMRAPPTRRTDQRLGDITIQAAQTSRTGRAAKLKVAHSMRRVALAARRFSLRTVVCCSSLPRSRTSLLPMRYSELAAPPKRGHPARNAARHGVNRGIQRGTLARKVSTPYRMFSIPNVLLSEQEYPNGPNLRGRKQTRPAAPPPQ